MTLAPLTRLGTYEVLGPLGSGGMGEVYRAKDLRLGREVAVKVLPAEVASSPERLALFEREARTVAGINHPNIVTLYSVEDDGGVRFLTMELVEGKNLTDLLAPGGLPLPRIVSLAVPLAEGLAAAHARRVVHRDLKPGNVMVTHDGRVKMLDFGLATVTHPDATAGPTTGDTFAASPTTPRSPHDTVPMDHAAFGTLPYMAPESIRGGVADARADIFALGVILYELATGRRPFRGETEADISAAILRDVPPSLSRSRPDLPAELERLVNRCLEKDPRERVATALDVANDLRRLGALSPKRVDSAPAPAAAGAIASIAVLPFVNRSANAEDEYFSDGLADELLNVLAKIRRLRVAARTSSFRFKDTTEDLQAIGAKLNVATLLEGSVRKAGNRVRIHVQLVNVSDGYHIWSQTYDRTLENIFAVQDDIAHAVVTELRARLLGEGDDTDVRGEVKAEVAKAVRGRGADPEAHRLFLLARHLIDRYTREEAARAITYLKEALGLDPEFAGAWAELSRGYSREAGRGWVPAAEGYARAREAAERALALEPNLAEGHATLAYIRLAHDWDWRGAETCYARALELAPGSAQILRGIGGLRLYQGRFEDAMALYGQALEQDPLSAVAYNNVAVALHASGRFQEAVDARRKALELSPTSGVVHGVLSESLLAQGLPEEALAEALQEPDETTRLWALAVVYHVLGRRSDSDEALRELAERWGEDSAYQVAEVHAARGERDAAFEWLERAYARRDSGLAGMRSSPHLRVLRGDPRWEAFERRMAFED